MCLFNGPYQGTAKLCGFTGGMVDTFSACGWFPSDVLHPLTISGCFFGLFQGGLLLFHVFFSDMFVWKFAISTQQV